MKKNTAQAADENLALELAEALECDPSETLTHPEAPAALGRLAGAADADKMKRLMRWASTGSFASHERAIAWARSFIIAVHDRARLVNAAVSCIGMWTQALREAENPALIDTLGLAFLFEYRALRTLLSSCSVEELCTPVESVKNRPYKTRRDDPPGPVMARCTLLGLALACGDTSTLKREFVDRLKDAISPCEPVAWIPAEGGAEVVVTALESYRRAAKPTLLGNAAMFRVQDADDRYALGDGVDGALASLENGTFRVLDADWQAYADFGFICEMIAIGAWPRDGERGWRRWARIAGLQSGSYYAMSGPTSISVITAFCSTGGLDGHFDRQEGWDWIFEAAFKNQPEFLGRLLVQGYRADKRIPVALNDSRPKTTWWISPGVARAVAPNAPKEVDEHGRQTGRLMLTAPEIAAAEGNEAVLRVFASHTAREALAGIRARVMDCRAVRSGAAG